MKYLALLRGINVGGKGIIKMVNLQKIVTDAGFDEVKTFIQSGNVLFEDKEKTPEEITKILEKNFQQTFQINIPVVVLTSLRLKQILEKIPQNWKKDNNLRCYIAFIKSPVTPKEVLKEVEVNVGIDYVLPGPGVLYLTTKMSGITKSKFAKLSGKKIYQSLTIRNYTTIKKIFSLFSN